MHMKLKGSPLVLCLTLLDLNQYIYIYIYILITLGGEQVNKADKGKELEKRERKKGERE